jgi:hypothetical protein
MRRIVCLIGAMVGATPAAAQTSPVLVARSGTSAPAGGTYGSFGIPVVGGSGHVAFIANLTGGSSPQGIFVGAPGALQTVVLQGTAAPAGGNYGSFSSQPVVVNGSGQVTFYADLTGGSSTGGSFLAVSGSVQTVALKGTAAPAGGNYTGLGTPALSASGQVAFQSALSGPETEGIFAGVPGALQTVAIRGAPAPGGSTYGQLNGVKMNSAGQVGFEGVRSIGDTGLFFGTPGAIQAVALQGSPAPGGGNYGLLGSAPELSSTGLLTFRAGLTGTFATHAIFAGAPGALQTIASQGSDAPSPAGSYSNLGNPVINASGQVAFFSTLTSPSSHGIFVGTPGSVQALALQNTPAPSGGTFSSIDEYSLILNASGQVAFVGTTTVRGLYVGVPGALVRVVAEGDMIDLDPGPGSDLRQVATNGLGFNSLHTGRSGWGRSFTDSGILVYRLTFTDGTSGVFTSQITPVPEPGACLAAAACGLAAAGWVGPRVRRLCKGPTPSRPVRRSGGDFEARSPLRLFG